MAHIILMGSHDEYICTVDHDLSAREGRERCEKLNYALAELSLRGYMKSHVEARALEGE